MALGWNRSLSAQLITRRDHIDAAVAAIDAVNPAGDKVLVGPAAGGALANTAVDAGPVELGRASLAGIERQ